jgi:DNA polymerase III delta subunit
MKPAEVRAQIAAGRTGPLYLLEGDDLQSRHDLAMEFAQLVEEGLQAFNVESFYANEATSESVRDVMIGAMLSTSRTLPMMVPRRVVVVHGAERLLSPRRSKDDEAAEQPPREGVGGKRRRVPAPVSPLEELEAYIERPEPLTTLVFVAGPLDGTRRLVKLLRKHAAVVDCGSLETPQEAASWIRKRLEKEELSIEARAVALLLEATGLSLGRIRAEIDKVVLYAAGESAVTEHHIRDLVMAQSEPGLDFALGKAIWNGNAAGALAEVAAQFEAGAPPVMVLGQIRAAAGRLRPDARAKNALGLVLHTDLALKSSGGHPKFLLERLVVELCGR